MHFLFLLFGVLWANVGPQGFHDHRNRVFVETGSFRGDGIQKALDAGFEEIHSLEIDVKWAYHCRERFAKNKEVHIWRGDSGKRLWEMIEPIEELITFWLDGHRGWSRTNGNKNTPLIEELEQIGRHPIKTHTILIDDLHCCGTELFDFITLDEIVAKVLEVNPNYHISFEPGGDEGEYPNNILVAEP